ncbi:unnamed protein product, partial [Pocillopora meandrina]
DDVTKQIKDITDDNKVTNKLLDKNRSWYRPSHAHRGSELQWWVDNLETATCPISNGNPDIVIDTDASLIGWGAVCNAVTAQETGTTRD